MNLAVLFSLILVVGMLVDGAIVTTELADRRLQAGYEPTAAYAYVAKRMAWPIIASTATTLSVFFPLIFIPVVGGLIGKKPPHSAMAKAMLHAAEKSDPRELKGFTGGYVRVLQFAILRPWATLIMAMSFLLAGFGAYGQFGNGISFFPFIEPEFAQVQVRARDNSSILEKDALVRRVETRLFDYDEIASVYARSGGSNHDAADLIGTIQIELSEWDTRRTAAIIGEDCCPW